MYAAIRAANRLFGQYAAVIEIDHYRALIPSHVPAELATVDLLPVPVALHCFLTGRERQAA